MNLQCLFHRNHLKAQMSKHTCNARGKMKQQLRVEAWRPDEKCNGSHGAINSIAALGWLLESSSWASRFSLTGSQSAYLYQSDFIMGRFLAKGNEIIFPFQIPQFILCSVGH